MYWTQFAGTIHTLGWVLGFRRCHLVCTARATWGSSLRAPTRVPSSEIAWRIQGASVHLAAAAAAAAAQNLLAAGEVELELQEALLSVADPFAWHHHHHLPSYYCNEAKPLC